MRYLAPEQGKGGKYSFGADIFSLGCICVFYANQGQHLFKNQDEIENWEDGGMEEVLDSDRNSADLVDMVGKMVRLEQKERPSAKEILEQCTDARTSCSNPRSLTFPDPKGPELPSVRGLRFLDSRDAEFVPRPKETSETLHNEPRKSLSDPKKKRKYEEANEDDSKGGKPEKKVEEDRKEIGGKEKEKGEEGEGKEENEKEEENAKQISLENILKKKKLEEKVEKEKKKVEVEKVEKKAEVEERENDDKFRWRLEELAEQARLSRVLTSGHR